MTPSTYELLKSILEVHVGQSYKKVAHHAVGVLLFMVVSRNLSIVQNHSTQAVTEVLLIQFNNLFFQSTILYN